MSAVFMLIGVAGTKIIFGYNFGAPVRKLQKVSLSYALIIDLALYVALKEYL